MKICFVIRGLTKGGVKRFIMNILFELDKTKKQNYNIKKFEIDKIAKDYIEVLG